MEITWYGLSCFRLAERGAAVVVTNPDIQEPDNHHRPASRPPKLVADIVTVNREIPEPQRLEAVQGAPFWISGPGEYEVGGIFITGIQTKRQKGQEPAPRTAAAQNTLYVFDFNSLTVAHLGDLDRVLSQTEIEAIGAVNVALVPVGGEGRLSAAQAAEVTRLLEPNLVIPMHEAAPGAVLPEAMVRFLKEMGVSEVKKQPSLKVTSASLPEETQVVVLEDQRGSRSTPEQF